ncbi:MAG TPA: hypothetical protein VMF11_10820 [Candidatus Baltobacteraceae bacterium]|nr:hypothetical protein [Candidatus Baltobacteraceae bacterium]
MLRWVAFALSAVLLSDCSGGGSNALPKTAGTPARTLAQVTITMHVPGAASAHTAGLRRIFTVAQNTAGAQVNVYTAGNDTGTPLATTAANIETSASAGSTCAASDAYGNRTCTFNIAAPIGDDDFIITTWDQPPTGNAIPAGANQLGWGIDPAVAIAAGTTSSVSATLSGVLASVSLDLTPAAIHQIIPATGTVGVYALDADNDVIVSNGFVDPNGNPITLTFGVDNNLNGALSFSPSSISAPSPTGMQYVYAPGNGVLSTSGTITCNISVSSSYAPVTTTGAALQAIYPSFTSITDSSLSVNNPYHGGIVFDTNGGVYYTTPLNSGGISYYSGSGSVSNYAASATAPILGSIVSAGGTFYAIAGNQEQRFSAPPASTIGSGPNSTLAPVPNGGAIAYAAGNSSIWYTSGSSVVDYPLASGSPNAVFLGVNAAAGVAVDASSNVWVVDNVNDRLIEYPGNNNPLQAGGEPWDVLANANGVYVTDHGPNPAIIQANASGIVNIVPVPDGAIPWYMMPDNAQPGIVWFDYLLYGQIGIGRMDTNVSPATFVMATDVNGPFGSQAGAIGAASNGLVYMVFDNTSTLVQVQR